MRAKRALNAYGMSSGDLSALQSNERINFTLSLNLLMSRQLIDHPNRALRRLCPGREAVANRDPTHPMTRWCDFHN
jgi:hypothetical protein